MADMSQPRSLSDIEELWYRLDMFSFHHVSLSVRDLQESLDFYSALGFRLAHRWDAPDLSLSIAHLKLGEAMLELFAYAHPHEAPATTRDLSTDLPVIGVKHFALRVPSIANAKAFLEEGGFAHNVQVQRGRTEIDYFFIKDPNGISLEIVQDDRHLS